MAETVALVQTYIQEGRFLHLLGVNSDKVNEIASDREMERIAKEAEIINADGASLVLASRFLARPLVERVAGIDLMQELLREADQKGQSVYLLGAKQSVVEETATYIGRSYPGARLAGFRNGYFKKEDWSQVLAEIEASEAELVFVGITSPIKEYLIDYFKKEGSSRVYMGVGGSFDVLSGNIPRAPLWMQKANLEWFFRMMQEPRRLAKRYLVGNLRFIGKVMTEKRRLGKAKRYE